MVGTWNQHAHIKSNVTPRIVEPTRSHVDSVQHCIIRADTPLLLHLLRPAVPPAPSQM